MRPFPHASLVVGLILALVTAAAFNWSWVAQHTITSQLPRLTIRHPWRSLGLLFGHRRWLLRVPASGSPAGRSTSSRSGSRRSRSSRPSRPAGSALLAVLAQRAEGEPLPRREWIGVGLVDRRARLPLRLARGRLERQRARARGSRSPPGSWSRSSLVGVSIGPAAPSPRARARASASPPASCTRPPTSGRRRRSTAATLLLFVLPVWACHRLAFTLIQLVVPARAGARDRGALVVLHERAPDRRRPRDLPRDHAARAARRSALRRVRLRRARRGRRRAAGARCPTSGAGRSERAGGARPSRRRRPTSANVTEFHSSDARAVDRMPPGLERSRASTPLRVSRRSASGRARRHVRLAAGRCRDRRARAAGRPRLLGLAGRRSRRGRRSPASTSAGSRPHAAEPLLLERQQRRPRTLPSRSSPARSAFRLRPGRARA